MHHDQGLLLEPMLDQPFDRGWLGAEIVGWDEPIG